MTREEAKHWLEIELKTWEDECKSKHPIKEAFSVAIEALEQEPCCNCIEFKRYAKQMGITIEKQSIPYIMHKEMGVSISECQKAYDVAIDYLRSQGKLKG